YGCFIPYTATFLTFTEYARNAVRMAALMKIRHIMIYTHDSIGLGEDGPTHQPIEQIANLRNTPNINVWRPCDQVESAIAWKSAIERLHGPTVLIFSRQKLIQQNRDFTQLANIEKGGYILKDCSMNSIPEVILIATGSEVAVAVKAYEQLSNDGRKVRVVSMPSTEIFDKQSETYREFVMPKNIRVRVAIEAGISDFWFKYVGLDGIIIGMSSFGASAPAEKLFTKFGFTVENIIQQVNKLLIK
ncbi:MAG: transketolase, partial [Pantoea sp. Brub]|nr:transketolase [Pantoea sp. Brub]